MELKPNPGKNLIINVDGKQFERYPVKTKLITPEDKDIRLLLSFPP
jgi:tRNA(His) 5'-end guanylyltransferase